MDHTRSLNDLIIEINRLYSDELDPAELSYVKSNNNRNQSAADDQYNLIAIPKDPDAMEDESEYPIVILEGFTNPDLKTILSGMDIVKSHTVFDLDNTASNTTGWPDERIIELDSWKIVNIDIPSCYPDSITQEDGPFCIEHANGKSVGIDYIPENSLQPIPDDKKRPLWTVQGPNTILSYEDTFEEAQRYLYKYTLKTSSPSGMV